MRHPDAGSAARAEAIRESNARLVLKIIYREGGASQSETAARTGLKAPTVFRIFSRLAEEGLIEAAGPEAAPLVAAPPVARRSGGESLEGGERKGRRPVRYRAVPDAAYALGVDLWAGSAAVTLQDFSGRTVSLASRPFPEPPDAEAALGLVSSLAQELVERAKIPPERILGMGVGAPGSVSVEEGLVHFYSRMPGMSSFPLGPRLAETFEIPVHVHNNASVVAMAEHRYGAARGAASLFAFLVRAGTGGAYLQEGQPLTDRGRTAFEVGHLSVDMNGPRCSCGSRGCLENVLSEDAILASVRERMPCAGLEGLEAHIREGSPGVEEALAPAMAAAAAAARDIRRLLAPEAILFVSRSAALSERLVRAASAPEDGDGRFSPKGGRVLAATYDPNLACRAACDLAWDAYFAGEGRPLGGSR